MPHRKHSSPRSHRSSSRDRKRNSSSSTKHDKEHDRRKKQRKPGSKCAQIKQLKALLASLRKEGALQTSEFINTLLRNPACRTAAQSSATPESAYMAIATQALNNAAQNRESIENSRIASDGSARSWIGNKWYRLKRGVSNNSGKVATAVLIAACVALYYMYGAEAIQNATGQAFTSVKEYAAYLAAQTGEYLTKLRNYFSGSPPPSAQTVEAFQRDVVLPVEQGMSMMTSDQLADQEAFALAAKEANNQVRAGARARAMQRLENRKIANAAEIDSQPRVLKGGPIAYKLAGFVPPAQSGAAPPTLMPASKDSSGSPPSAQTVTASQQDVVERGMSMMTPQLTGKQLAYERDRARSSNNSTFNDSYFKKKSEELPDEELTEYFDTRRAINTQNLQRNAVLPAKRTWQIPPGQQLANEYARAKSSTDSTIATDLFWDQYYKKLSLDEQGKYLKANKANFGLIKGGASRNTAVKNRRKPAHQDQHKTLDTAHKVQLPNLKQVSCKSSPSVSPRKAKNVTNKPAKNASKSSKSPNSKRSNSNSTKSSHGMTLRKRT